MKKRVLVVSGGYIDDVFAGNYINNRKYEIRIACDRGMEFYKRAGLQPDLILGDFDSADPKVLPFGTRLRIPGYGEGVVEDTGGAVTGRHIDVWFSTHEAARRWGSRRLPVDVLPK